MTLFATAKAEAAAAAVRQHVNGSCATLLSAENQQSCATKLSAGPKTAESGDGHKKNFAKAPFDRLNAVQKAAKLAALERERAVRGLSINALAIAAGISAFWYRTLVRSPLRASDAMIARVARALRQADAKRTAELAHVELMYGGFLAAVCHELELRVDLVREADPTAGKNNGPGGHATSTARQLAIYLVNQHAGVKQRALARAVGVSPAAICIALRAIEDARDSSAIDALIETVSRQVTGRTVI